MVDSAHATKHAALPIERKSLALRYKMSKTYFTGHMMLIKYFTCTSLVVSEIVACKALRQGLEIPHTMGPNVKTMSKPRPKFEVLLHLPVSCSDLTQSMSACVSIGKCVPPFLPVLADQGHIHMLPMCISVYKTLKLAYKALFKITK